MQNVPFYDEVVAFTKALVSECHQMGHSLPDYEIAAEHAHSCCILVAQRKFKVGGNWHTTIDYGKFFHLLKQGTDFTALDYMAETPDWAVFGNGGFNPEDERHYRKRKSNAVIG